MAKKDDEFVRLKGSNDPQPVMLLASNGVLVPVQSWSAAAAKMGLIRRLICGEDKRFISWKGMQDRWAAEGLVVLCL